MDQSTAQAASSPEVPDTSAMPRRYTTFRGITCESDTARLLERMFLLIDDPAKTNAFWEKFRAEIMAAENLHERKFDGLCLVCARVGILYELFEEYEDEEGLAILEKIENECC